MMRERDIRQETFEEYKDSKQSKLVTFSALTTGVGMLAAFGFGQFSFFFGSAIGLVFIIVICRYIYVFRKKCKKRRDLIMRGYRTEAEVVELKQETDLDGDLITVAVYRFTLSGGEEHRFKRPVNSSIAGLMGAIQVGAKFDIFVDPNNPLNFYLANPDVSKYTVQELKQMPGVQDADSHILDKYLQKLENKDSYTPQWRSRKPRKSMWSYYVITYIMILIPFAILTGIIALLVPNMHHDPIELPFGAYISSKGTTEVYQCYPETNEWSYYLDEFGVTRTKDWRYDSQCSEPLELQYDFSFAFGARPNEVNTPRLLIPESYRDRLDEFIKDKDDTDKTLL